MLYGRWGLRRGRAQSGSEGKESDSNETRRVAARPGRGGCCRRRALGRVPRSADDHDGQPAGHPDEPDRLRQLRRRVEDIRGVSAIVRRGDEVLVDKGKIWIDGQTGRIIDSIGLHPLRELLDGRFNVGGKGKERAGQVPARPSLRLRVLPALGKIPSCKSSTSQSDGAAQESNLPSDGLRRLTGFDGLLGRVHLRTEAGFRPCFRSCRCREVRSGQYQFPVPTFGWSKARGALSQPRSSLRGRR